MKKLLILSALLLSMTAYGQADSLVYPSSEPITFINASGGLDTERSITNYVPIEPYSGYGDTANYLVVEYYMGDIQHASFVNVSYYLYSTKYGRTYAGDYKISGSKYAYITTACTLPQCRIPYFYHCILNYSKLKLEKAQ